MRKRTILIGLSLVIFFPGIIFIGVSTIPKSGFVQYKEILVGPLGGSEIEDMAIQLPYPGTCGINFTGSFQGYEGQSVFVVWDRSDPHMSRLVFSAPEFHAETPPPRVIEFGIDEAGFYSIDFNIIVNDDSGAELYQYRYRMGDFFPYAHLYPFGVPLAISGLVGVAAGLFIPFKSEE